MTLEFGSHVVDAPAGAGISSKPAILETIPIFFGCFALLLNDFQKVSNRFDAREGIELHLLTLDLDFPGANGVNVDFMPRVANGFAGSEITKLN